MIKGDVGMLDQRGHILAMVGEQRHADADARFYRSAAIVEWRVQMIGDAGQDRLKRVGIGQAGQQHGKFVAAHPRDQITRPQRLAQPSGHGA
jgi:hypothetical protein